MNQKGMSMVEVVVGFLMILLMFTAFYKVVRLSENMMVKYQDREAGYESYQEDYYKYKEKTAAESGGKITDLDTVTFSLRLDTEKTDEKNQGAGQDTELGLPETSLHYYSGEDSGSTIRRYFFR